MPLSMVPLPTFLLLAKTLSPTRTSFEPALAAFAPVLNAFTPGTISSSAKPPRSARSSVLSSRPDTQSFPLIAEPASKLPYPTAKARPAGGQKILTPTITTVATMLTQNSFSCCSSLIDLYSNARLCNIPI